MATYQIHGPGLSNYTEEPKIYMTTEDFSVSRPNSGDTIYLTVTASISALSGFDYFGYALHVYASLDSTSSDDAYEIFSKPNSPSQWGADAYKGSVSLSSTNKTTSCTLYIWTKSNCPCHDGEGDAAGNTGEMKIVQTIPLTAPEAGNKPATPTLSNNNKYNNPSTGVQNGVSASTTTLTIGVSTTDWGKPDTGSIHWSCNNGGGSGTVGTSSQFTISGLKAGTSYTVTVYLSNSKGSSGSASITIRTRHNPPSVSISLSQRDLEKLIFKWSSDKDLKSTQYKIDNGSWTSLGQTGKSGTFTTQWFDPKTTHTIHFRGTSTNTLDALLSAEDSASGTTHDRAHITNIGTCTFGVNIAVTIQSESNKQIKIEVWVEGNGLTPRFTFDNIGTGNRTWTFAPTQAQLDQMYRCYPKANTIPIHFRITTHGEWKDWQDIQQDRTLTLTGIAKTAHVGDSSNKPRRCQVWVGDSSNKPRRAVCWVGVDGQAHRTI